MLVSTSRGADARPGLLRRVMLLSSFGAVVSTGVQVRADDTASCADAALRGQVQRDAHQLIEARQSLEACTRPRCPKLIQEDCASWLAQITPIIPTVTFSAKDRSGKEITDVRVLMDGRLLASRIIDAREYEVNPGRHRVRFEFSDGSNLEQETLVREGERRTGVAAAWPSASVVAPDVRGGSVFPWRALGYGLGITGIASITAGAILGLMAISEKTNAHCADGWCDGPPLENARRDGDWATAGFVGGGVLVAVGSGLLLFANQAGPPSSVAWRASPLIGSQGAGLSVQGRWQ